jgi:gamma-glutamyltranspeptidase/glutathione hydrolase
MWDRGHVLEIERGFPASRDLRAALESRGHVVETPLKVAGGMNGVMRRPDGMLEGAACWRADGAPMGYSGGDAIVEGSDPPMWTS